MIDLQLFMSLVLSQGQFFSLLFRRTNPELLHANGDITSACLLLFMLLFTDSAPNSFQAICLNSHAKGTACRVAAVVEKCSCLWGPDEEIPSNLC